MLGFYHKASLSLQAVNTQLQQQPNSPLKMRGLYSLGTTLKSLRVLEKKGDNLGAIDTLKQALKIATAIGDRDTAEKIKLSLGNTIQLLGTDRHPEAIELYQQLQSSNLPIVIVQAQINSYKLQSDRNSDIGDRENRQAFLGGIAESRQGFASLPAVKSEIAAISKLIPNQQLLNEKFNNRQVASNLVATNSQIIHLATHGQFSSKPEDTFILTWDSRLDLNGLQNLIQNRNMRSSKGIDLLGLSAILSPLTTSILCIPAI